MPVFLFRRVPAEMVTKHTSPETKNLSIFREIDAQDLRTKTQCQRLAKMARLICNHPLASAPDAPIALIPIVARGPVARGPGGDGVRV